MQMTSPTSSHLMFKHLIQPGGHRDINNVKK